MGTAVLSADEIVDRRLREAMDCVAEIRTTLHCLDAPDLAVRIPDIAKLIAAGEAAKLEGVRLADALHVGDLTGARSTADWIADVTREKPGRARRDVDLAARLDDLDQVGEALAGGSISKTQADVLAGATGATSDEQHDLLDLAGSSSVGELEQAVKQFQIDRDQPAPTFVPGLRFQHHPSDVTVDAILDPISADTVITAVGAAADQLSFDKGSALAERHAARLVAVARYFLDHADTGLHRHNRPHVTVEIPIATIETRCGTATLASGTVIDAAIALAWACDADITRLITGPVSEPLDVGRRTRLISKAIWTALAHDDGHCRWPGCTSPLWSTQAHHVIWWGAPSNGETKLKNLVLLCWHHHHLVHRDSSWQLTLDRRTRALTVAYDGRLVDVTHPPGRRTAPAPAPAPTTENPDARPDPRGVLPSLNDLADLDRQHTLLTTA